MESKILVSRRRFLHDSGIGLGALAVLPGLSLLSPNRPEKRLGIALVGLGSYSTYQLAPALLQTKNCYLAGLVTGTPSKADDWSKKYQIPASNVYNYQNFDEIAKNKAIDIVYVVLPVSMHKEFTIRAAKAGKHVICEKPMAVSAADCQEMVSAVEHAGKLLSIGYRLHFEPHNLELMRLGQKQVFGKVVDLDTGNGFLYTGNPDAWRLKKALAGGGGLMDMGTYSIQATRYTLGQEPVSVTATQEKTRPDFFKDVDETVFWELEFPGGFKTKGKSSYNNNWSYIKVKAEHGEFELGPAFGYGPLEGKVNGESMDLPNTFHQVAQMDDFATCVRLNKKSRIPGEEGLKDMKVIDAIYRSLDSGKAEKIV